MLPIIVNWVDICVCIDVVLIPPLCDITARDLQ